MEVHFQNLFLSTKVHFRHFMAYGSRLPELNHLRKLTSGLWFMFHSHIYIPINTKNVYTYRYMTNMAATTQKMKN